MFAIYLAPFCCAGGKAEAAAMLGRKELKPFHVERWDLAHRAADYPRWATADSFYEIAYEHVR